MIRGLRFCGLVTAATLYNGMCGGEESSASADLSSICTDRPTKGSYACTVDANHLQYEADFLNVAYSRFSSDHADTWMAPNPTFKYGLDSSMDLEANFAPWVRIESHDQRTDSRRSGIGDLLLRVKYRFLGANDSILSASFIPYVKLPTARSGIGNGAVEEGLIVPINYKLSADITLSASPEFDLVKNSSDGGRHVNTLQTLNVGIALNSKLIWYAEIAADWNLDPHETTRQCSADIAFAYLLTGLLQLDLGWNAGLNRQTPALQGYLGIAQKF